MQYAESQSIAKPGVSRPGSGLLVREVLAPGAFVIAILVTNYAMTGLPNVKLFDLLVLVAGYSLGLRRGALVAVAAWMVYGSFNPFGYAQPQLLATLMASEVGYAAAGALIRRVMAPSAVRRRPSLLSAGLLAAAVVATGAYDLVTNAYTGYFWATIAGSSDYGRWIPLAMFHSGALFFMAVHVGSNAMLFPVFGPLLMQGVERGKHALGWR